MGGPATETIYCHNGTGWTTLETRPLSIFCNVHTHIYWQIEDNTGIPGTSHTWLTDPYALLPGNYSIEYLCADQEDTYQYNISYDISGNDNTGTNTGYTWNHGEKKNGVDCTGQDYCIFDGVDDYINSGNDSSLQISESGHTVSIWYYITSFESNGYIIAKRDGAISEWGVYAPAGDGLRFYSAGTWGSNNYCKAQGVEFVYGAWNHVLISSQNNISTIYVNGYDHTDDNTCPITQPTSADLFLGVRGDGAGGSSVPWTGGAIGNTFIRAGTTTSDQALAQYNAGMDSPPLESDGLVLWLPMRDITQNTTHTYDTNHLVADDDGGEAQRFDGTTDYKISIPSKTYDLSDTTFAFDLRRNSIHRGTIFGNSGQDVYKYIQLSTNGYLYFETDTNEDTASAIYSTYTNTSSYSRFVISCHDYFCSIYINGINRTIDGVINNNVTLDQLGLALTSYNLDGDLDNVVTWNRHLSLTEISDYSDGWTFNPTDSLADGLVYYNSFDIDDRINGTYGDPEFWFVLDNDDLNVTVDSPVNGSNQCTNFWLNVTYVDANLNRTNTTIIRGSDGAVVYNNYSGVLDHATTSYAVNHLVNISNGSYTDGTYTIVFSGEDYGATHTYSANYTLTINHTELWINVYDDTTFLKINDTIDLILFSDSFYETYSFVNGSLNISDLLPDIYTATFSGEDYALTSYNITLGCSAKMSLNAYLTNSTSSVIFSVMDDSTEDAIEGAIVTVMKYIDDVLTIVNVLETDITGRVEFSYQPDTLYSFIIAKTGYTTKTFQLNPILFESYEVYMESTQSVTDTSDYAGVSIYFTPKAFYEGWNNITITIGAPDGDLQYYQVNMSYPGGSNSTYGTNAYGQSIFYHFNVSTASFGDRLNLTIIYKRSGTSLKTFNYQYAISPSPPSGTIMHNKDEDYGLGVLDKIIIVVFIVLCIGGIAVYYAGETAGIFVGLLTMGIFVYSGFISFWFAVIPFIVGFIALAFGSRQ